MSIEIKHILVALDDAGEPKKGMEKAIYIAKLSGAKITGVNVMVVAPTLVSTVTNYRDYLEKKAQEMLGSVKESCEKQGIQFAFKILDGSPASKIAKFAEEEKVDLVIVGSRDLGGGITEAILGSVANSIVHKSKVSVLVVK